MSALTLIAWVVIGLYFCYGCIFAIKIASGFSSLDFTGGRKNYAIAVTFFGVMLAFFGWGFYLTAKNPNLLFLHADRLANDLPFKPWKFKEDE